MGNSSNKLEQIKESKLRIARMEWMLRSSEECRADRNKQSTIQNRLNEAFSRIEVLEKIVVNNNLVSRTSFLEDKSSIKII